MSLKNTNYMNNIPGSVKAYNTDINISQNNIFSEENLNKININTNLNSYTLSPVLNETINQTNALDFSHEELNLSNKMITTMDKNGNSKINEGNEGIYYYDQSSGKIIDKRTGTESFVSINKGNYVTNEYGDIIDKQQQQTVIPAAKVGENGEFLDIRNQQSFTVESNPDVSGGLQRTVVNNAFETKEESVKQESDNYETKPNEPEIKVTTDGISELAKIFKEIDDEQERLDYISKDIKETFKNGMRVSLNILPINRQVASGGVTQEEFNNRVGYILGTGSSFLYQLFYSTKGLVFPYTPTIAMNHNVNYEEVEILHSNTNFNFYKNTPPPGLQITADFTADTPENALYMLGAIWFFRALSKTDFGKNSEYPGMPPPILYLNGYGKMYDNIPVILTSFNVTFDKNKHYVDLKMTDDMYKEFMNIKNSSTSDKRVYNLIRNMITDQWLPTDLTMQIGLKIIPNMRKVKEKFDLSRYKRGDLGNVWLSGGDNSNGEFNGHGWTW